MCRYGGVVWVKWWCGGVVWCGGVWCGIILLVLVVENVIVIVLGIHTSTCHFPHTHAPCLHRHALYTHTTPYTRNALPPPPRPTHAHHPTCAHKTPPHTHIQATLQGFLTAGLFFCISNAKPRQQLSPERPHPNIFCVYLFASLLGQFACHITFLIMMYNHAVRVMSQVCCVYVHCGCVVGVLGVC